MAIVQLSPIVSARIRYLWERSKTGPYWFKRRVPPDLVETVGKEWVQLSLGTRDPRVAALLIAQHVAEQDRQWSELRSPSRQGVMHSARQLLVEYGIDPLAPKDSPEGALGAFETFIEAQLPRSVAEDENVTEGWQLDRHLSPVHAAALQMRQGRDKFTLADCLDQYVTARPDAAKDARMVFGYLGAFLEEQRTGSLATRDLRKMRRQEVNAFVKWLLEGKHSADKRKVSTSTVSRYLTNIRAAFARAIRENELGCENVFAKVEIPQAGKDVTKRETFTVDQYRHLYRAIDSHTATEGPDQLRCILTLVAETGARLAEIVGLAAADVHTRGATPYLDIREHPWRSLKTLGSVREVPLTPRALEAAQAALRLAGDSAFLFPAYTSSDRCKADTASASLVKWVRSREGLTGTKLGNHSLRHGMEDLLRAVGCPDSGRDQITGHKTPGMGANYGEGYPRSYVVLWRIAQRRSPGYRFSARLSIAFFFRAAWDKVPPMPQFRALQKLR